MARHGDPAVAGPWLHEELIGWTDEPSVEACGLRCNDERGAAMAIEKTRASKIEGNACDLSREAGIDFAAGLRKTWLR